jgi:hypothetical protein
VDADNLAGADAPRDLRHRATDAAVRSNARKRLAVTRRTRGCAFVDLCTCYLVAARGHLNGGFCIFVFRFADRHQLAERMTLDHESAL